MSATVRALNIFELVENILLHTTTFEIQVAANVCTFFRDVVENSSPLKALIASKLYEIGPQSRTDVWHSYLSTINDHKTLFVLRLPAENLTTFLLSDSDHPYLRVLDVDYNASLNFIYAGRRNTEFWEQSEEGIRSVLYASRKDREKVFDRCIARFYSQHKVTRFRS